MSKLGLFIIISCILLWLSRKPLRDIRSHGFFRTWGWLATLWLLIENYKEVFIKLWQWNVVIANILLVYSFILAIGGIWLLLLRGRHDAQRTESHLFAFEKTSELIVSGVYRFVRHPLYASLVFLTWGLCFLNIYWLSVVLACIATFLYIITMKVEEKENETYFGKAYSEYIKRSKMLVPFIL